MRPSVSDLLAFIGLIFLPFGSIRSLPALAGVEREAAGSALLHSRARRSPVICGAPWARTAQRRACFRRTGQHGARESRCGERAWLAWRATRRACATSTDGGAASWLSALRACMRGQGGRRRDNRAAGVENDMASWLLALRACVAKAEGSATSGLRGELRGELGERDQRAVST
jgi:hypothetical protein